MRRRTKKLVEELLSGNLDQRRGKRLHEALDSKPIEKCRDAIGVSREEQTEFYQWLRAMGISERNALRALRNEEILSYFFTTHGGQITKDIAISMTIWVEHGRPPLDAAMPEPGEQSRIPGMGWIHLGICVLAAALLYGTGWLFWVGIAIAGGNFWSFGIMHNFRHDPDSAPDFWALVNMATALTGIALLIYIIVMKVLVFTRGG